jgi:hypothetical protein
MDAAEMYSCAKSSLLSGKYRVDLVCSADSYRTAWCSRLETVKMNKCWRIHSKLMPLQCRNVACRCWRDTTVERFHGNIDGGATGM